MTDAGKENKEKALGMPYGTASGKLRKMLLFDYAKRMDESKCYRCGIEILHIEEFSIDHKKSWLFSKNPIESFFDLNNIAFSHIACNAAAASPKPFRGKKQDYRINRRASGIPTSLCSVCKLEKPRREFGRNTTKKNGLATECLKCRKLRNKASW